MEYYIETYGYLALFVVTLLQGEAIVAVAGFAVHRGFLRLDLAILAASAGTFVGDLLLFWAARSGTEFLSPKRPSIARVFGKVTGFIGRYHDLFLIGYRFMYGIRTAVPIILGLTKTDAKRFAALNAVGALLWTSVVCSAGYLSGTALQALVGDLRPHEIRVLLLSIAAIVLVWVLLVIRKRKWYQAD